MGHRLHISFFGSSLVSSYWNGAATYYRGIVRALWARGHDVTFYEPDAHDRQQHRDLTNPSWARVVVYRGDSDAAALACLQRAARTTDVLIKASGIGVYDRLLEEAILAHRRAHQLAIFWDMDAPATLDRVRREVNDAFRPLIPKYDLVFTYGGGERVVQAYRALGAKDCIPVYNALDPRTHFPVRAEPRFDCAVALLANRLPDREARVDEFFLRAARALPKRTFVLGGAGWADKTLPPNVRAIGHVATADHNAFNSSPLTVLNVSREGMASTGFSPPTRVFEAAGAGACLITDAWDGIEEFLTPGREVLVARTGEDVARHVTELTLERARAIGQAARSRVLAKHTYAVRARQVESILCAGDVASSELHA
jgi:spore maturation protein CgeB